MNSVRNLLGLSVTILACLGFILLSSASTVRATALYGTPSHFVTRQLYYIVISVAVAIVAACFDYHKWQRYNYLSWALYVAVLIGLMLVFPKGIGGKVNGSYRWINLGPFKFQPSELAKIAIVILTAVRAERIGHRVRKFLPGVLLPAGLLALYVGLLILEPDFGATLVVILLWGVAVFVGGARLWHLGALFSCGLPIVGGYIALNPNRMERLKAFLEGADSTSPAAFHLQQAIIAFKNGGPFGVGLNKSIQKQSYLPEAHTDFIFAIGGEELGAGFSLGVVLLFLVILVCGTIISMRAPDILGRMIGMGMTMLLVFQAAFNICVVTGVAPTKGLALPFMSYGGSNMIAAFFAVGTLYNIAKHIDSNDERIRAEVVRNAVREF